MSKQQMMTMDDSQASYKHASAPAPVKSAVLSSSMPMLMNNDRRVKVAKGNTSSTIRKVVASEKSAAGNNVNTVRKLKINKSEEPPEGTKFFTFTSYPSLKPEIDLYPNLVEQKASSMSETKDRIQQTDEFLERPESPAYIPAKIGVDTSTQIEISELFDFDLEVIPLLETLVSKTIEQAVFEVQSEEELQSINEHIEKLEMNQKEEKADNLTREKQYITNDIERKKYVDTVRQAKRVEYDLCTRIAAMKMMNEMLPHIVEEVVVDLVNTGVLADPTESQVKNAAIIQVASKVSQTLNSYNTASQLVDELLGSAQEKYEAMLAAEEKRRESELQQENERLRLRAEEEEMLALEAAAKAKADAEAADGENNEEQEEPVEE